MGIGGWFQRSHAQLVKSPPRGHKQPKQMATVMLYGWARYECGL